MLVGLCACGASNQGQKWVHDIKFIGVKQVSVKDLKSRIAMEKTSWIPFSPKKYLDPFTLGTDKKRIVAYYNAHGFFSARIVSEEVKDRNEASVDVTVKIDEGPPTRIVAVDVSGLSFDKEGAKILRGLHLKKGDIYDEARYMEGRDAVEAELKQRGFAWATVKGEVDVNRDAREATVRLAIDPGPQSVFGSVQVKGAKKVTPADIARQSGVLSGRPFTPVALEDARGKLYHLGLFASVRVEYVHAPGHDNVADVVITVEEAKLREIRVGVGLGLESLRTDVHLLSTYTQRNFFGGLRTLELSLKPGYVVMPAFWDIQKHGPEISAEARFTQPDLVGRYSEFRFNLGYDVGIDYAYQFHGPRTLLGMTWPLWKDRVHIGVSYNFQWLSFFNTDSAILQNPTQAGRLYGYSDPYRLGWLQQDLSLDLRDKPVDASKGGFLGLTAEEGGIYAGGAYTYEKLVPEVRVYAPLGSRVVLAGRVQYGRIFVQGDLGSPITRRFYLGGPNSHRGFTYNRLSPQIVSCRLPPQPTNLADLPPLPKGVPLSQNDTIRENVCDPTNQRYNQGNIFLLPVGGDEMFLGQVEVRVNLVRLFGYWLSAAAFFDAGDVVAAGESLDFTNLHLATGGGLRYKTIIGTIRFDLGVRLNRVDDAADESLIYGVPPGTGKRLYNPDTGSRFAYHISIGEAF